MGLPEVLAQAKKYYANIVMPYSRHVARTLDALDGLDIDMIAPSHGVIWRSHVVEILETYARWSSLEPEDYAIVVYDSMWHTTETMAREIVEAFVECGVPARLFDLKANHISDIMTEMLSAKYVAVGSPTLNNGMMPTVAAFLCYLKGLSPKGGWAGRVGIPFGSYGWGTNGPDEVAEALEKWPENMMRETLPRIYSIMQELNRRLCQKLFDAFPGQWDRIGHMAILAYDQAHMANMCVAYSHAVNGVSQLHGDILKHTTFADYYAIMPEKFYAITNGITPRRWLMLANPSLSDLLDESIGQGWRKDLNELEKLLPFADDAAFVEKFAAVKKANKERFSRWIYRHQGLELDPTMMFDVQVKRLHEYKRQLLNALHILVLYNRICDDPNYTMAPRTFIFGAKAAASYKTAKRTIELINSLSADINADPVCKGRLQVFFLENYRVSVAEKLMPAAQVSEQISTAGKEASGTGNMKLMMNGAVTIGTLDGANVEMYERLGDENMFLFGLRANEVEERKRHGYDPNSVAESDPRLRRVLQRFNSGLADGKSYADLVSSLLYGGDQYMLLADFASYVACHDRLYEAVRDRSGFARMGLVNIAESGIFAADRAVREYAENIWKL